MAKENLETKSQKAILSMNEKVTGIYDLLGDLSLELSHIIKSKGDYYGFGGKDYHRNNSYGS